MEKIRSANQQTACRKGIAQLLRAKSIHPRGCTPLLRGWKIALTYLWTTFGRLDVHPVRDPSWNSDVIRSGLQGGTNTAICNNQPLTSTIEPICDNSRSSSTNRIITVLLQTNHKFARYSRMSWTKMHCTFNGTRNVVQLVPFLFTVKVLHTILTRYLLQ